MARWDAQQPAELLAAASFAQGLILGSHENFLLTIAFLANKLIDRHFLFFPSALSEIKVVKALASNLFRHYSPAQNSGRRKIS